ncbi:MAG: hypothetical protein HYV37_01430 [Candidatus Levyibacteriota bacterium]|nr:MAG: hypothetical protein HYV37_01430 [Candidatus Levybacteria bacterium]
MAQVSKRYLHKDVEERILDLFWMSLAMLSTKEKISMFLDDLLSPTEKLMLSKRLAIAFMLIKGHDYPLINNKLKVSNQTIWNVKTNLTHRGKGYKMAVEQIMSKEKWEKFWQDLDHFLTQALPPKYGTNWTEVRRKQWEERRKQNKPF